MIKMLTIKVTTNSSSHFVGGQGAGRFDYRPLSMCPSGLYRVEPGTLGRQPTWDYLSPLLFSSSSSSSSSSSPSCQHRTVVLTQPFPHFSACMPTRIVPYHHQYPLAFSTQPLAYP